MINNSFKYKIMLKKREHLCRWGCCAPWPLGLSKTGKKGLWVKLNKVITIKIRKRLCAVKVNLKNDRLLFCKCRLNRQ